MNQEIVYTGDNCGDMTKEDVMSDINLWIRETDEFTKKIRRKPRL